MKYFNLVVFLILSHFSYDVAFAIDCNLKTKITGFSTVKKADSGRAYFFKEPKKCEKEKCTWKRKAYIVSDNFVQTSNVEGDFVCVLYRNFNGYGGKKTVGWMQLSDLNPIRTKLERADLVGDWIQSECENNESCVISISENEKKLFDISGMSYLHNRPAEVMNITEVKEELGQLLLSGTVLADQKPRNMLLIYDAKDLEPGTFLVKDADDFSGVYYR